MRNPYFPLLLIVLFFSMILISTTSLCGQSATGSKSRNRVKELVEAEYDRNSISILLLNLNGESFSNDFQNAFNPELDQKYFNNALPYKAIRINANRPERINDESNLSEEIRRKLATDNLGGQVMLLWNKSDANGQYSTLLERSQYNMTAADMRQQTDPQKIENIKHLFFRNFILVFDISYAGEIYRYNQIKNIQTESGTNTDGLIVTYTAYLFKVNIDDATFSNVIVPRFDNSNQLKSYNYPITYVTMYSGQQQLMRLRDENNQPKKSDRDMYAEVSQNILNRTMNDFVRDVPEFKAKTIISGLNPIRAEIGAREGVRIDQRFFVYENRYNRELQQFYSSRVGVLRATAKIADNTEKWQDEEGDFLNTRFRKVSGRKLREGMVLVQEPDLGFQIMAGVSTIDTLGIKPTAILTMNLARLGVSSLRAYLEVTPIKSNTSEDVKDGITRYGLGLSKDMKLTSFFDLIPYAGMHWRAYHDENVKSVGFYKFGCRASITLRHNVYIVGDMAFTTEQDGVQYPRNIMLRYDF